MFVNISTNCMNLHDFWLDKIIELLQPLSESRFHLGISENDMPMDESSKLFDILYKNNLINDYMFRTHRHPYVVNSGVDENYCFFNVIKFIVLDDRFSTDIICKSLNFSLPRFSELEEGEFDQLKESLFSLIKLRDVKSERAFSDQLLLWRLSN